MRSKEHFRHPSSAWNQKLAQHEHNNGQRIKANVKIRIEQKTKQKTRFEKQFTNESAKGIFNALPRSLSCSHSLSLGAHMNDESS